MKFNEDTRVKIPVILHLVRLGYQYLSLKSQNWDTNTNIFHDLFRQALHKINPGIATDEIDRILQDLTLSLDNDDLGQAFYEKISACSGTKIIDFDNFNNNSFHVVTELIYQNGNEEFRPDITILINGLPLVFIEVKKPNNPDGILAERDRIIRRFKNPKFKRFVNITQFMIFSNNMEYDDDSLFPVQGAFYASPAYGEPIFNYFREEKTFILPELANQLAETKELEVLKDNNLEVIRHNPEYLMNKEPNRPTNRICTSLLYRERLKFILRYALAYVEEQHGVQKHIMRYPQLFATKALQERLDNGIKKGIIWHTQGSGKTALAYYNVKFLTDYFQLKNIIPKFYFIVDRIDLLMQAQREFRARGLTVHTIDSREEFARDIKTFQAIHNDSGRAEITVVNIQKFKDDPDVIAMQDYNIGMQRVYFLDEVHRSYNPKGSFLANLNQSDRNAIKIGLTGTPLLGEDYNSRTLFGEYIHKYYYNSSIADGYTLRLIREEITTNYKIALQQALEQIEIEQGSIKRELVFSHDSFVEPMLDYIVEDFEKSRGAFNDATIGGLVICDSAEQARKMFALFNKKYALKKRNAEDTKSKHRYIRDAALILHDVGTKQERAAWVENFKTGMIDLLFVYNMLLTGFDAKRLKKLYLGRIIKAHNLLQALTRVNRPYNDFRYGYVVDFADIRKEFDATNRAYFEELESELGGELEHYSHLFKSQEEISSEIEYIKDVLFAYDVTNAEHFSQQINEIQSREIILNVKKALEGAKHLYNILRLQGDTQLLKQLDFQMLNVLYREVCNHLDLLNLKEKLEHSNLTENLLNIALEDVIFKFKKMGEEELIIADQLREALRCAREALASNFDQEDPNFLLLRKELERLFKKKNLSEVTQDEMKNNIEILNKIYERVKELNRQNNLIRQKYSGDAKYTRVHKRLLEYGNITQPERKIFEALAGIKRDADEQVLKNTPILDNERYFEQMMMPNVVTHFEDKQLISLDPDASDYINHLIVSEYINEFNGVYKWL